MPGREITGQPLMPTRRQIEVLRAYVAAGTQHDAAEVLGIAARTVEAHLAALRLRLGVHNEVQAVYALWLGYRDHASRCDHAHHEECARRKFGDRP